MPLTASEWLRSPIEQNDWRNGKLLRRLKPVFNILEGSLEVMLINAREAKRYKARKTDVIDAEGLADLLRHGLLKPLPDPFVQEAVRLLDTDKEVIEDHSMCAPLKPGVMRWRDRNLQSRITTLGQIHGANADV